VILTSLDTKMAYQEQGSGSLHFDGKNYQMWQRWMAAFLRGKGQMLWDVTVNTTYVHPVNFLAPGSRDMFDANNKAVDYLYHALCQSEFDWVQTGFGMQDLGAAEECSCWKCSGSGLTLCDLPERVRELHSSPR
jgi:hypothetical protein